MRSRGARWLAREQRAIVVAAGGALLAAWLLWQLRELAVLVAFAVLFAYVLDPLVDALTRIPLPYGDRLPRAGAAAIVMVVLVVVIAWVMSLVLPRLVAELTAFIGSLPQRLDQLIEQVRVYSARHKMTRVVEPMLQSSRLSAGGSVQALGALAAKWVGPLFGGLVQVLGLAVLPLLTFYLLADREQVLKSLLSFVPIDARPRVMVLRRALNRALRSYVRGQAVVCLIMGSATGTALALLGFPVALLLGVIVGLAEVVPYLGFVMASLAIGIAGIAFGVSKAIIGISVYATINLLNSLLVTPRVMGRYLEIHPFVVTVSILAGAQLLGPAGALIALPATAVIQSVGSEIVRARIARRRAARRGREEGDEPDHGPRVMERGEADRHSRAHRRPRH